MNIIVDALEKFGDGQYGKLEDFKAALNSNEVSQREVEEKIVSMISSPITTEEPPRIMPDSRFDVVFDRVRVKHKDLSPT